MSCCSGKTQTRQMTVVIVIKPNLYKQFQLKFQLQGRNGQWKGRYTGQYDFGDEISCGTRSPSGMQDISMKMELSCTESDPLTVGGFIDINAFVSAHRFHLPTTVLDCPHGGPGCVAVWSNVFFNQYLGNGTITVRGDRNA